MKPRRLDDRTLRHAARGVMNLMVFALMAVAAGWFTKFCVFVVVGGQ